MKTSTILKTAKTKEPVKTSDRKRPNKAFILKMADFRGFMTANEKLQLKTLDVKNVMQRVNNRSMSDNVNDNFTSKEVAQLTKLINEFVKNVDSVINQ